MKRKNVYNHIPKHLRPPKIPKITNKQKRKIPKMMKEHIIFLIGLSFIPVFSRKEEAPDEEPK